jgi:hypothetical protein
MSTLASRSDDPTVGERILSPRDGGPSALGEASWRGASER